MKINLNNIATAEHPIKINLFDLIKLYRLIKKLIRQLNKKSMCFRKIFGGGNVETLTGNKVALIFGVNNYPGTQNDLNGCLNDGKNIEAFLKTNYPEFVIQRFTDSQVTRTNFRNTVKNQIVGAKAGDVILVAYSGHGTYGIDPNSTEADGYSEALYLYDGPLWDYELREVLDLIPEGVKVVIPLDSCFSGGMWKEVNKVYKKSKFVSIQDLKPEVKRKSQFKSVGENYIVFAGCSEHQTSADAYISGAYCGAFTHFWLKAWQKGLTYWGWNNATVSLINASGDFEQVPELDGDQNLVNQIVFI